MWPLDISPPTFVRLDDLTSHTSLAESNSTVTSLVEISHYPRRCFLAAPPPTLSFCHRLSCFLPSINEVLVTLVKSVIHDSRNWQAQMPFRTKLNTSEMLVVIIPYRESPSSKARVHLDFSAHCSNNQAFVSSLSIFSDSFSLASNFFSSLTLHNTFNLVITSLLRCFF
jgi:hypothetical protein